MNRLRCPFLRTGAVTALALALGLFGLAAAGGASTSSTAPTGHRAQAVVLLPIGGGVTPPPPEILDTGWGG